MADLQRTIEIIFAGDDQSKQAFGSVQGNLGDLKGHVEAAAAQLAGVADSVLKADAALLALAVGGLAVSIHKAGEFNLATSEISTLIDDATFNVDEFRKQILEYAQTSTQSIEDINGAIYSAISAGIDYKDALEAVSKAEELAVAGKATLKESMVALESVLNAYGASADQAGHYSDILFQTVRLGITTLPELAQSLASVTSIAAAAGVPFETVTAAIASLTAQGMPTSEAVTAIRGAISNLIKPTKDAADYAAELGIGFDAQALASRGLEGVLQDVWRATDGNVDSVARLFGNVRGLTGVLALFGQDGGDKFLEKLDLMRNASGATGEAYSKMVGEITFQNQKLLNTINSTFISIGQPLLENYSELVGSIAGLFQGLNVGINEGSFQPVFDVIKRFGADVSTYIDGIAKVLPEALRNIDWGVFTSALEDLAAAFQKYLGELDLTKPEDLAAAIQTAVNLISGLIRVTEGMVDAFRPILTMIGEFVIELAKTDDGAQQFAGQILAWAKLINTAGLEIAAALIALGEAGASGAQVFGALSYIFNSFAALADKVALGILAAAKAAAQSFDLLTLGTSGYWAERVAYLEKLQDEFRGRYENNIEGMRRAASMMAGGIEFLESAADGTSKSIEGLARSTEETGNVFRGAIDRTKEFSDAIGDIPDEKGVSIEAELIDWGEVWDTMERVPTEIDIAIEPEVMPDALRYTTGTLDHLTEARPVEIKPEIDPLAGERLKLEFSALETAIEWSAKIDIAAIEADAERISAIFGSIDTAIISTGETLSDLWGTFAQLDSSWDKLLIRQQIDKEEKRRQDSFELQKQLTEAEIRLTEARAQRMEVGEGMITITADGLEPELEAFMWRIIERVRIRAAAEESEFLLGI